MERLLNQPSQSIFWSKKDSLLKQSLLILSGVIVLTITSQLSIRLQPVPLTLQAATVALIGLVFGSRYATKIVATYLIAALCGLPILANFFGGVGEFLGPTGGYLFGFLPAAWLSGYLAEHGFSKTVLSSLLAAFLSISIIFATGLAVLSQFVGMDQAITLGLKPFVISETIQLIIISLLVPKLWKKW